jgi:hypothetical protein
VIAASYGKMLAGLDLGIAPRTDGTFNLERTHRSASDDAELLNELRRARQVRRPISCGAQHPFKPKL